MSRELQAELLEELLTSGNMPSIQLKNAGESAPIIWPQPDVNLKQANFDLDSGTPFLEALGLWHKNWLRLVCQFGFLFLVR